MWGEYYAAHYNTWPAAQRCDLWVMAIINSDSHCFTSVFHGSNTSAATNQCISYRATWKVEDEKLARARGPPGNRAEFTPLVWLSTKITLCGSVWLSTSPVFWLLRLISVWSGHFNVRRIKTSLNTKNRGVTSNNVVTIFPGKPSS